MAIQLSLEKCSGITETNIKKYDEAVANIVKVGDELDDIDRDLWAIERITTVSYQNKEISDTNRERFRDIMRTLEGRLENLSSCLELAKKLIHQICQ